MAPLFKWWGKEKNHHHRGGTPVVVKMENPKWSMVELEGPSEEDFIMNNAEHSSSVGGDNNKKGRGKNAKQLTWVLLLKAHRAAGCLASVAPALFTLVSAVKRRVASRRTDVDDDNVVVVGGGREKESLTVRTRFYSCIKVFLLVSVLLLCFEVAAYFKGWHFDAQSLKFEDYLLWAPSFGVKGVFDWLYSRWVLIRVEYLAPPLQFLANVCIVLFIVQSLDRLVLCLGCFWIRFKNIQPVPKVGDDLEEDHESGEEKGFFPMVLVQIPMCNEREVRYSIVFGLFQFYVFLFVFVFDLTMMPFFFVLFWFRFISNQLQRFVIWIGQNPSY